MSSQSQDLIRNLSFVVFDLETTGGNHKNDKIIEIGLTKIENLLITDTKEFLIRPNIPIPKFIQKLTNIKTVDLKDAPLIEDVIDEILLFMGDSILVAHNTSFDIPFLNSELTRLNLKTLKNKSLCTNLMTKNLIPDLMNSNLNYMCNLFEIGHERAHRALDDAYATAKLLIIFLEYFIERGITKINHLYYPKNRFELARINYNCLGEKSTIKEKEELVEKIIGKLQSMTTFSIISLKGENGVILFSYIGRSSKNELNFIKNQIIKISWKMITISLAGGLVDAYINFEPLYKKMNTIDKDLVINFMWKEYLNEEMPINFSKLEKNYHKGNRAIELGDFVVSNHLVHGQYSIYPIGQINKKNKLVFRYPAHSKKLLQYLKNKSNMIKIQKNRPTEADHNLTYFVLEYLKKCKKENKEAFFLNSKESLDSQNSLKRFESFLIENPNTYDYPKKHI